MHETQGQESDPDGAKTLSHAPEGMGKAMVSRNHVMVWWLVLDDIGAGDWPKLRALLPQDEQVRADRFHFERDRLAYTAAHALCRGLLSACTGQLPANWQFSVGDHGKPELICVENSPRFRVNISHTRGLAAVALTLDHDIGVDAEWLKRPTSVEALAERMFARAEQQTVAQTPENARNEVFLAFWTLKEAYVKAIGKGLSQPLDAFAFDLDRLRIDFEDAEADDPATWHFRRFRPSSEHIIALALNHPEPARVAVQACAAPLDYLLGLAAS